MGLFNIGFNIGFHGGINTSFPPFIADAAFDFNSRTDLTLAEAINGNDAAVVGGYVGVFVSDNGFFTDTPNILNDTIEFMFKYSYTVLDQQIFQYTYANNTNAECISSTILGTGELTVTWGEVTVSEDALWTDTTTLVNGNWYKLTINIGGSYNVTSAYLNGLELTTSTALGRRYSLATPLYLYFGVREDDNYHFIGSACCVKFGESYYHLNGHTYDSITGTEATNNGVTFELLNDTTPESTQVALDEGYYENDTTGEQVINPQYALPAGWTEHAGSGIHNFVDSYIDLNPTSSALAIFDIFDRSNTTIYAQIARDSVYYDATNPFLWHISEVDYDTMQSYLNTAYQDRNFAGLLTNYGTQLNMFRFFSYANPKVGQDLYDALDYCNYWYTGHQALTDDNGVLLTDDDDNLLIEGD